MRSTVLFRTGNSLNGTLYDCGVLLRDTETLVVLTVLLNSEVCVVLTPEVCVVIPYNFKLSAHGMSSLVLHGTFLQDCVRILVVF